MEKKIIIITCQLFLLAPWMGYREFMHSNNFGQAFGAGIAVFLAPVLYFLVFYLITKSINLFRDTDLIFPYTNVIFWIIQFVFAIQCMTALIYILE
jgi:hypothetical protein